MNKREALIKIFCDINNYECEYEKCKGTINHNCIQRGYCCIKGLSDEQLDYIFSDIQSDIYLNACPGSGKTEVLGIKIAHEIKKWNRGSQGIAVLTFTNSAEKEILNRVSLYANKPVVYPHFIGTFTSWLHGYIANPHLFSFISNKDIEDKSINLFESSSYNKIALNYNSKYTYKIMNKINPTQFYESVCHGKIIYTPNKEKQKELDDLIKKDDWRKKELLEQKSRFNKANLYTYEDVEQLVYKLLKNNKELQNILVKRFPIIFIDECQDLSKIQICILEILRRKGANIHIIGDLDQSIYGFRWVNPNDTLAYIKKSKYIEMKLTQNYRSCQKIVNVSGEIIARKQLITGVQEQICDKPLRIIYYERGKEHIAVQKYKELLQKEKINYTDSYIIVRNNVLKNKIIGDKSYSENAIESMAKALYYYKNYNLVYEFRNIFIYAGKAVNNIFFKESIGVNKVDFYCPKSFRVDEWRILLFNILDSIKNNTNLEFSQTWSKWKIELKKELTCIKSKYKVLDTCTCDLGRIRNNMGDKQVSDMFIDTLAQNNDVNITTIHGSKGMSLDSILFFSSYQKSKNDSGAFWKSWFDRKEINEKNRLAYISFSRAKHLLVLAIPRTKKSKDSDFDDLFKHGFVIYQ